MNSPASSPPSFRVLIAGGGVAALEAALRLRELAGERITTTLLAPELDFVYRPIASSNHFPAVVPSDMRWTRSPVTSMQT